MVSLEIVNHHIVPVVSIKPSEVVQCGGVRVEVPRIYLQGTQTYEEYSENKMRKIDKALAGSGIEFLRANPALAYAIPNRNGLDLALKDAHHRTRRVGKFSLPVVPTIVLPLEAAIDLIDDQYHYRYSPDELKDCLYNELAGAKDSFIRRGIERKRNDCMLGGMVIGSYCVADLSDRFSAF